MTRSGADLRAFVARCEAGGVLRRVAAVVDPYLEIAAITDRISKAQGPALCFSHPAGREIPVLTNLFGSPQRAAWAIGHEETNLDDLCRRMRAELAASGPGCGEERLARLCPCSAPVAADPAWGETRGELAELPALHSWPGDGGRYLTLAVVVTRDPCSGEINYGLYRVQLLDGSRALIAWRPESGAGRHHARWRETGRAMPVSIVLGAPPALLWAASAPLPPPIDEAAVVGYLTGHPLPLVASRESDLPVPLCAEAVLEGTVAPEESGVEGPFGNHTGSYTPAAPAPLFRLKVMHRRRDMLYPGTVVGPPPMEDVYLAQLTARLFLPLMQCDLPELIDLAMPAQGVFHGCALVAWRSLDDDPRPILAALRSTPLLRSSRLIVLCDAATDVHAPTEVFWKALNRVRPSADIIPFPGGVGIDARRAPFLPLTPDPATLRLLTRRASEYDLPELL